MMGIASWLKRLVGQSEPNKRDHRVAHCLAQVEQSPRAPHAHLRLAEALEAAGETDRAFLSYRQAAWLYRVNGSPACAEAAHKRALLVMPRAQPETAQKPGAGRGHLRIVSNRSSDYSEVTQVNFRIGPFLDEEYEPALTDQNDAPVLGDVATEAGDTEFPSMQKTEIFSFDAHAGSSESLSLEEIERLIRVTQGLIDFVGADEPEAPARAAATAPADEEEDDGLDLGPSAWRPVEVDVGIDPGALVH